MGSPDLLNNLDQRIVFTGVGGHGPTGETTVSLPDGEPTAFDNLIAGQDGIRRINETILRSFKRGYRGLPIRVAGGIDHDIDSDPLIGEARQTAKFWGRPGKLAYIAMDGALKSAQADPADMDRYRIGHYTASVFGGSHSAQVNTRRVRPTDGPKDLFAQVGMGPAMAHGLKGRGGVLDVECAGGGFAIEAGIGDLLPQYFGGELQEPKADMVLVGGTDSPLVPVPIRIFAGAFKDAVDFTTEPKEASRPFDVDTHGLVVGEAAVMLVAETLEKALARGLKPEDIIGELAGYASLTDANTLTLAGLEGMVRTMVSALKMAKVVLGETVYVNAHATGTPTGDAIEAIAIRETIRRLSLNPDDFYINSTKGATGHTMGTAGAIEFYFALMALKHGVVPPALKLRNVIPEFTQPVEELGRNIGVKEAREEILRVLKYDLPPIRPENLSPLVATEVPIDVVLSNSFGFAGGAESLVARQLVI